MESGKGFSDEYSNRKLTKSLKDNSEFFKKLFRKDATFRYREICPRGSSARFCIFFFDGMTDSTFINKAIISPLLFAKYDDNAVPLNEYICKSVLSAGEVQENENITDMLRGILYGDTLLLIDGLASGIIISTKGWHTRGISEPTDERILQGPREGFEEGIIFNLSMLKRKLATPDLCIEPTRIGRRTDTQVCLCYLDSLVNKKALRELKSKIRKIDIDGILDVNYIAEMVQDHRVSLLKTVGSTERPDIVAARLLEGRIAVFVDGTPVVMTVPYLFSENFQSDDDYYQNFWSASVGRILRYICFFISISIPAIYVSLVTFHIQLLPTALAISIAEARSGVPISTVGECLMLIFIFEVLKESGARMPQSLGHALSIVGGLVVGQAAVDAKIISIPMLIVIALSGISGIMIPRLKAAIIYARVCLVILAAFLGIYGYLVGITFMVIRILSMRSFGVDYVSSLNSPTLQNIKDSIWRLPWRYMKKRPIGISENHVRNRSFDEEKG